MERKWRKMSPSIGNNGYLSIRMKGDDGRSRLMLVHRLLLITFVGMPKPDQEACHNDGNKLNNSLGNLRWDTRSANVADAIKHGTFRSGSKRLTKSQVVEIRKQRDAGVSIKELASEFLVSQSTISSIANGVRWVNAGGQPASSESKERAIKRNYGKNSGSNNGRSKLTHSQVREIRLMLKDGVFQEEIANKFSVSPSVISRIKSGITWKTA